MCSWPTVKRSYLLSPAVVKRLPLSVVMTTLCGSFDVMELEGNLAIQTQNLVKDYKIGRHKFLRAVNNLDLEVRKGEVFGFLGPNGSGKTTVILLLVGLLKPTSGEMKVLGLDIPKEKHALRPRIGYMPQDLAIYPDLTVMEHILHWGRLYGLSKKEILTNARELLEIFGLEEKKDTLGESLSGGMKRRLSLMLALIHKPDLVLADEPTVGVDPVLRVNFWAYFARLKKEQGTTFLVTTHVFDEAEKMDRVGLISEGQLVAVGSPRQVQEKYQVSSLEDVFLKLANIEPGEVNFQRR